MTRLASIIRSAGLMPLVKPVAERVAGLMGMRVVPSNQVPGVGWTESAQWVAARTPGVSARAGTCSSRSQRFQSGMRGGALQRV